MCVLKRKNTKPHNMLLWKTSSEIVKTENCSWLNFSTHFFFKMKPPWLCCFWEIFRLFKRNGYSNLISFCCFSQRNSWPPDDPTISWRPKYSFYFLAHAAQKEIIPQKSQGCHGQTQGAKLTSAVTEIKEGFCFKFKSLSPVCCTADPLILENSRMSPWNKCCLGGSSELLFCLKSFSFCVHFKPCVVTYPCGMLNSIHPLFTFLY